LIKPNEESLVITKLIRRLRGGSQAWQVQCEDSRFYVAKFAGNPQGNRSLVNDWIVSRMMQRLGISTPAVRLLHLPAELQARGELHFCVGKKRIPVSGNLHFGSMYPVDPEKTAIFDFLPEKCLAKVINLADFAKTWVTDKWLYQTDTRQAIFARTRVPGGAFAMRAYMIDHGMCFGGTLWALHDEQYVKRDLNHLVCRRLDMHRDCAKWATALQEMDHEALNCAASTIPETWFEHNDRECLAHLMQLVRIRQRKLCVIIERHLASLELWPTPSLPPVAPAGQLYLPVQLSNSPKPGLAPHCSTQNHPTSGIEWRHPRRSTNCEYFTSGLYE
jgi:hypothetical protein